MAEEVAKAFGVMCPSTQVGQYALLMHYAEVPRQQAPPGSRWGMDRPPKLSWVPPAFEATDAFLKGYAWRRLRMEVLKERGARCECCGATPKDGIMLHVDHIKPRRKFPELALEKSNLQILCEVCNHGKGNWDETDWRETIDVMTDEKACEILSRAAPRLAKES